MEPWLDEQKIYWLIHETKLEAFKSNILFLRDRHTNFFVFIGLVGEVQTQFERRPFFSLHPKSEG